MADGTSPEIKAASWGQLETEEGSFKDARLFPCGAREWDWNEFGTHHDPGVGPAEVEELLERGATTIILGTGYHGRLRVQEETLKTLEREGVEAHVLRTEEAVGLYNRLRDEAPVGALVHSTC